MPNVEQILASASQKGGHNGATVSSNEEEIMPSQDDLRKEVERLRIEVEMVARSIAVNDTNDDQVDVSGIEGGDLVDIALPPEAIARGFKSPEDFSIKERSLKYKDGSSYDGECLGTLKHGKGTFKRSDGATYSGDWQYDALDGHARAVMPDGQVYEGPWKAGRACGKGEARYQNGSVYQGDFENDARHGWGSQKFPTGDIYEGEWFEDKIQGQGRWTHPDGSFYEGEWVNGERVHGKFVSFDGSEEYSGQWKGDKRHGQGVYYSRGGFKYAGEWKDNLQHGKGRCVYIDNSVYDGEWVDGKREGKGKYNTLDGLKYDGEWANDQFHGKGCLIDDNGDRYVGSFAEGKREGFGRCVYNDGHKYEGDWCKGKRNGRGICNFANGDLYKGEWKEDKRHGQGVCRFADGIIFRGLWEDDAWVQSGADPAACRVAGPGVTKASAGKEAKFKILAKDHDGNRRLDGNDEFQVMLSWIPDHNADLMLRNNNRNRNKEYYSNNSKKENSNESQSENTNESSPKLDKENEDKLQIYEDLVDNVIPSVRIIAAVQDNDDGTYDVSYTPEKAGIYELQILLGGNEHVADSPYPVRVVAGPPDARNCEVYGSGRSYAVAKEEANFEIAIKDKFENICFGAKDALIKLMKKLEVNLECPQALVESPDAMVSVKVQATSEGKLLCSYCTPETPGFCRLHLMYDGKPLPGTPFSVRILSRDEYEAYKSNNNALGRNSVEKPAESNDQIHDEESEITAVLHNPQEKPIKDETAVWNRIAAVAYAADGVTEGWDSDEDTDKPKSSEDEYMQKHPDVPVVENLEDLWLVSKLQNERKMKEEEEKKRRLEALQADLEAKYGPGEAPPGEEETMQALKEIVENDRKACLEEKRLVDKDAASIQGNDKFIHSREKCSVRTKKSRAELLSVAETLNQIA